MKITFFGLVLITIVFYSCEKESIDSSIEDYEQEQVLKASILSDHDGKTYYPGDIITINWDFAPNFYDWSAESVNIDLYASENFITRIASSINFELNTYRWIVPNDYYYNNLRFKITNVDKSYEYNFSQGFFSIEPQNISNDKVTRESLTDDYIYRMYGRIIVRPDGHDVDPELYMYIMNYYPDDLKPLYMFQKGTSLYHIVLEAGEYVNGFNNDKGVIGYVYKQKIYSNLKPLIRYDNPNSDEYKYSVGSSSRFEGWSSKVLGYTFDGYLKD